MKPSRKLAELTLEAMGIDQLLGDWEKKVDIQQAEIEKMLNEEDICTVINNMQLEKSHERT